VAVVTISHEEGIMDVWLVSTCDQVKRKVTERDEVEWTVTLDQDRSASLLVRVWLESATDGFRARLTSVDTSPGDDDAEVTVGVVSSPTDVLAVVRTWLNTFLGPGMSVDSDPS
jgi:hypothetical protein